MTYRTLLPVFLAVPVGLIAQTLTPLAIPPLLEEDTFHLVVDEHVHQFYPGVNTPTYGVNGDFLGPTMLFHHGDSVRIHLQNDLEEVTSMHWHGLQVPGDADGGPPRTVDPGEFWDVKFLVKNRASTYWYHPHPHAMTAKQVTRGLAGMIIVQDEEEAALDLPRTYGVDDIPVVVQDRRFLSDGSFVLGPFGDSVLVNGTPNAVVDLPAQVVRLRLLNGSNSRIYQFGFTDDHPFDLIGSDGGLLEAPINLDRVRLSNGERAEILLDLTGMEGDSLTLMAFNSELTSSMPGSSYILWEGSALNGLDFPVLRIHVGPPTVAPVTSIPATLATLDPPLLADVSRTRYKAFSGNGMVGMGMFMINGLMFDVDVVNDTVTLGATEIWNVLNGSDIAHPFHIHSGSFFVLDRDGQAPHPWEQGAKDMVLVDMAEQVRLIMKFEEPSNGWPFMYHCHNLMHEDNMMMLQFIVEDANVGTAEGEEEAGALVYPSPAATSVHFRWDRPVSEVRVLDTMGRTLLQRMGNGRSEGDLDLRDLPSGTLVVLLRSGDRSARVLVVKE